MKLISITFQLLKRHCTSLNNTTSNTNNTSNSTSRHHHHRRHQHRPRPRASESDAANVQDSGNMSPRTRFRTEMARRGYTNNSSDLFVRLFQFPNPQGSPTQTRYLLGYDCSWHLNVLENSSQLSRIFWQFFFIQADFED